MNVNVAALDAAQLAAEGLIVGVPEGATAPAGFLADFDAKVGGVIAEALNTKTFQGKEGQVELLYPLRGTGVRRLALVGLGKEPLKAEAWRRTVSAGVCALADKVANVAVALPDGMDVVMGTGAAVEGGVLTDYRFHPYQTKPDEDEQPLASFTVLGGDAAAAERAHALVKNVMWVRDQSNAPGNILDVPACAAEFERFAKEAGLSVRRFDQPELLKEGFGLLCAVGRGSDDPPVFLVVEHKGGKPGEAPIVLVGKGITFDTGGVCIKPRAGMEEMKTDMHGAATMLATVRAAAERKLAVNLVALLPIAENMPDGDAYKPGDIFKAYNGLTVEVADTDAEGRLILADALSYGVKHYQPKIMLDCATLTGSVIMALGYEASGLFSNDDQLSKQLLRAGQASGERLWRLPTWDSYNEAVRSDIADVRHIAKTKGGDAINAAMFLKRFVGDAAWAHLDIAGPSWLADGKHYHSKGSTGVGVRLLIDWLERDILG